MKVTSIVENTSAVNLPVEHGLSLYIQMGDGHNVLFDMGQRHLFKENADRLGLSISNVDIAIISHGHYDHGGGLRSFLQANDRAPVYIHKDAFLAHYSLRDSGLAYIGIDKDLADNERLIICGDKQEVGNGMTLFAAVHGDCCRPHGNKLLFGPSQTANDTFTHEQNLIIEEDGKVILIAGCAHNGIVNIMRRAEDVCGKTPTHVFAGMHLVKSGLSVADEQAFIENLADKLMSYKDCKYFTMHCTGTEQYLKLKDIMGDQIKYLSCGESLDIR